ncbi:MAG: MotB family protein [Alphaproteobacteria bacterium]|nr:MotB family protein [Alphaproteobacteria bacterium]MBU1552377.1 MotB family protein [Alphaproteobacteria bacterium]MBU2339592.1 MotB family protein [Alphaproteobacteria bacterium]MBU2390304.1 MotB family protein [Alphaproteobacteria bacterium]
MSDGENHHHGKNEIIIVKRHKGDHDGAHGGAWKIAYADFMTAMMAFFLVMWLVNAANEETKASMASYFNPIKLSDETPAEKGLEKPVDQAEGEEQSERSKVKADGETIGAAAATGEDLTSTSGDETNYSEADYFENPYSVLAEIAQEVGQQANVSAKGEGGAAESGPATGADGGEAYRDPFDPDFWTEQVQVTSAEDRKEAAEVQSESAQELAPAEEQDVALAMPQPRIDTALPDVPTSESAEKAQEQEKDLEEAAVSDDAPPPEPDAEPADPETAAEQLREQIAAQIQGVAGKLAEGLVVTPAEGGLLVTISDQNLDPMFNVGSAVPRREMVIAMEKIGKILEGRQGDILVRGHTDGRQFQGTENDNWRLSMARAHSAYYMLVRGGLDEGRVKQVSGFADRRLQLPDDPLAAGNRRIEILLQAGEG